MDVGFVVILYAVAVVLLVAEIFIPSHGALTVAGLVVLGVGVYETYAHFGKQWGIAAIGMTLVFLPVMAWLAVKYWPNSFVGRKIAPPNRVFTEADTGFDRAPLKGLIGTEGSAVTPLRPIGKCSFGRKKVVCVAESGMIDRGARVEAVGIRGQSLVVRPQQPEDPAAS